MAMAGTPSPPNPYVNGALTKWLLGIFGALAVAYFTWLGFAVQEVKLGIAVVQEQNDNQKETLADHEKRIRKIENGHNHPDRGPI